MDALCLGIHSGSLFLRLLILWSLILLILLILGLSVWHVNVICIVNFGCVSFGVLNLRCVLVCVCVCVCVRLCLCLCLRVSTTARPCDGLLHKSRGNSIVKKVVTNLDENR